TRIEKLEDGSKVILYKNSFIRKKNEDGVRAYEVGGRMYFDVKRNEKRPFRVYTEQARVEVLGTTFTLTTENDHSTEVIVESGNVLFSQNPENYTGRVSEIELNAGEKGLISPLAKGLIKQNNHNDNYLAWVNQVLVFKRSKLEEVSSLMMEVYGREMIFEGIQTNGCRLSARYDRKSPEQIAKYIAQTFNFTYLILENGQIVFKGEGC
ncbi:MAG: FecR family protein, partial [Cyclobacteriaceae bacterium]|nr:FecR family protein [Cyclobacteriaceae bacterium]